MPIVLKDTANVSFVSNPSGLLTQFNGETNCFAYRQDLVKPFDDLSSELYKLLRREGLLMVSVGFQVLYDKLISEMRSLLSHEAKQQLSIIERDMECLQGLGKHKPSVVLIWSTTNQSQASNTPHHDIASDCDDIRLVRRILCDYNHQNLTTTGFRNSDVALRDDLFLGHEPSIPVKVRTVQTADIFYRVKEGAEAIQFPLGTMFAFAYGRARRENADPIVQPYAHIATPISGMLDIPRIQVRVDLE